MLLDEFKELRNVTHTLTINKVNYNIKLVAIFIEEGRSIYKLSKPLTIAVLRPTRIEDMHYRKMLIKEIEYLALDIKYGRHDPIKDIYKFTISSIDRCKSNCSDTYGRIDHTFVEEYATDIEAADLFKLLQKELETDNGFLKALRVTYYTRRAYDYVFILSHTLNLNEGSFDYLSALKGPDNIWTFTPLINPTDPLGYREKDIYRVQADDIESALKELGHTFGFETIEINMRREEIK